MRKIEIFENKGTHSLNIWYTIEQGEYTTSKITLEYDEKDVEEILKLSYAWDIGQVLKELKNRQTIREGKDLVRKTLL